MAHKSSLPADVNFLFEMGNIRLITRMGSRFLGVFQEDLADHHSRVFWIAMVIAGHEGNVDTGKEVKIVKDADNLDVDFELAEQAAAGHELPGAWKDMQHARLAKFYTKTAKQLFEQLQESNPHDWHMKGRNRFNAGDWKPEK